MEATFINAGNPAIFVSASSMGLTGAELQGDINGDMDLLTRFEAIRAHGAVIMDLAESVEYAMTKRQHTPKIAFLEKRQVTQHPMEKKYVERISISWHASFPWVSFIMP
ncbi:PrpF domain-containing protein [Bacillus licheniformis]